MLSSILKIAQRSWQRIIDFNRKVEIPFLDGKELFKEQSVNLNICTDLKNKIRDRYRLYLFIYFKLALLFKPIHFKTPFVFTGSVFFVFYIYCIYIIKKKKVQTQSFI